MAEVSLHQRFAADPLRVFALLTDHVRFGRYMGGARISLERPGVPPPNGLGAVRKVTARGLAAWEEVVGWEDGRAMDYRVIRGGPLREHLGQIRVHPAAGGGTDVDYRIRFRIPWYFGGAVLAELIKRELARVIGAGLARMAQDLAAGGSTPAAQSGTQASAS